VYLTRHGAIFASRIAWVASDQLKLRPWEREQYLGTALDDVTFDRIMSDDKALSDWLVYLDEWEQGKDANGERWLVDMPHSFLQ
jgi:hypothetical protein